VCLRGAGNDPGQDGADRPHEVRSSLPVLRTGPGAGRLFANNGARKSLRRGIRNKDCRAFGPTGRVVECGALWIRIWAVLLRRMEAASRAGKGTFELKVRAVNRLGESQPMNPVERGGPTCAMSWKPRAWLPPEEVS